MSKMRNAKITCPECGKEHDFTIWDSVNTQLDPSFKEKARTGELFRFTCPDCGTVTNVMYQCLYHQMEDKVMIYFIPNGPVDEAVGLFTSSDGTMISRIKDEYTRRVVTDPNAFLEKLKILDEGLDDRTIELMKVIMWNILGQNKPDLSIKGMFLDKTSNGERCFAILTENGKWATVVFDKELYDHVAETFRDMISADQDVIVDRDWAMRCMMKQNAKES